MSPKQTIVLITGILGGLFGILASFYLMILPVGVDVQTIIPSQGIPPFFLSILGIIGAGIVVVNSKASGTLMLIPAIFGLYASSYEVFLSKKLLLLGILCGLEGVLFLIGGILALSIKKAEK